MDEMKTNIASPVPLNKHSEDERKTRAEELNPNIGLQHYICHERVLAAEIRSVSGNRLTFVNGSTEAYPHHLFSEYTPVAGDFLVICPFDGDRDLVSRKDFLNNYHAHTEEENHPALSYSHSQSNPFGKPKPLEETKVADL